MRIFLVLATEYAPFLLMTLDIFCSKTLFSLSISISLTSLSIYLLLLLITMVSECSMSLEVMGLMSLRLAEW